MGAHIAPGHHFGIVGKLGSALPSHPRCETLSPRLNFPKVVQASDSSKVASCWRKSAPAER